MSQHNKCMDVKIFRDFKKILSLQIAMVQAYFITNKAILKQIGNCI